MYKIATRLQGINYRLPRPFCGEWNTGEEAIEVVIRSADRFSLSRGGERCFQELECIVIPEENPIYENLADLPTGEWVLWEQIC